MDSSWIILGGFCVFMGAVLVYVVLMIFWPEWVGITGKAALEAERSHADERASVAVTAPDTTAQTELNPQPKQD